MAKKVLRQSIKPTASRKDLSRASFERALKNAIRRRSLQQDDASLFDEAIPESFRSFSKNTSQNPSVRLQESSTLSPFILELRTFVPSPEAILAEEPNLDVRLNFLTEELERELSEVKTVVDTLHDLEISENELLGQLNTNVRTQDVTQDLTHALSFERRGITQRWLARDWMSRSVIHPEHMPLRIEKPVFASIDAFEPKPLPENILSYFDLPEEEEVEKSRSREEETETLLNLESLFDVEDVPEADFSPTLSFERRGGTRSWIPSFQFLFMPDGWQRAIGVFVLLSFVFVLPLHAMQVLNQLREAKSSAESNSLQALQSLKDAAGTNLVTNPSIAGAHFAQANVEFGKAKENIDDLGAGVNILINALAPTQKSVQTNTALLTIGTELSIAGSRISDGFDAMQQEVRPTPSSRLEILHLYLASALPHLITAQNAMSKVDVNAINEAHRDTYAKLTAALPSLVASTKDFVSLADALGAILGTDQTKHYLLVFQNNTEIRPTGGFMGSFAEMTVHNGVMEQLDIPGGGTYDLKGQQKQFYVSPWPLQLLSAQWQFQDANWFPDFRTSARHIISFYKNARSSDIDGVIAINAKYVQDLIGLLGPVDMPEYNRTIDQNNFINETQTIVENEYDKTENKPKAFIGALAPKLIEKALHESPDTFLTLADQLNKGLGDKDIQLYFTDDAVEKTVLARGWGGAIKATDKDYLMLVNANLGGGKTDAVMEEHVYVDVHMTANGTISNTVKIARTHHGDATNAFAYVNNVNYQRLYVPKGSTLTHADGFTPPASTLFETPDPSWIVDPDLQFADASFAIDKESGTQMYEENGKTVFGNWTQTKPGETTVSTYTYTLPFTLSDLLKKETTEEKLKTWIGIPTTESYTLLVQKQSGVLDRTTSIRVHIPESMKSIWSSSDLSHTEFKNTEDNFFSTLLEPTL